MSKNLKAGNIEEKQRLLEEKDVPSGSCRHSANTDVSGVNMR